MLISFYKKDCAQAFGTSEELPVSDIPKCGMESVTDVRNEQSSTTQAAFLKLNCRKAYIIRDLSTIFRRFLFENRTLFIYIDLPAFSFFRKTKEMRN